MALSGTQFFLRRRKSPKVPRGSRLGLVIALLFALAAARSGAQGPPYQTDDPVPVDLHHYEFYIFGGVDGTPVELDSTGPAFEFNWGALPRVQLHAILPWGVAAPLNHPVYAPSGAGPDEFGLTDMELGAKIAFIKESKHFPQIGSFTMFEMPTGNSTNGLGVGKVSYKLPIWVQKNFGKWSTYGGGGYWINPGPGNRNYWFLGWQVQRQVTSNLTLGGELFHQTASTTGEPGSVGFPLGTQVTTGFNLGGTYDFSDNYHLLFSAGRGIQNADTSNRFAYYLGFQWTF